MTRLLLLISVFSCTLSSCVTRQTPNVKFGINAARAGFVPARIALTPCMAWPGRATPIKGTPVINRPREELTNICDDLDKYVADGFDNQPYMKGLSPKLVEKLYSAAGMTASVTDSVAREWSAEPSDCADCKNLPAFYASSIQSRPSWQIWLNKFSGATKGSDAIMIPVVLSTNTRVEDDRGVLQSIRSGSLAILLIDTNDGSLIWSGGRDAVVIYKALIHTTSSDDMKEPPLDDLKRRLLTEALWLEFPGRQIYR